MDGECLGEDRERLIVDWVISARSGEMSDLNDDMRRKGHEMREEDTRLALALRTVVIDIGVKMHHDGHAVRISGLEHGSQLLHLVWIVQIDVGVTEVELQANLKDGILRTAFDLLDGIVSERVDSAEGEQSARIPSRLRGGPVVFVHDLAILVRNRRAIGITEL